MFHDVDMEYSTLHFRKQRLEMELVSTLSTTESALLNMSHFNYCTFQPHLSVFSYDDVHWQELLCRTLVSNFVGFGGGGDDAIQ